MPAPDPTPSEKALRRVLAVSRLNGWSVVVVAGLGFLLALLLGDWLGALLSALAVGSGGMEVHGHRRLRRGDSAGMKWLVRSQLFLLSLILAYCASRLGSFDAETAMGNLTPEMEAMLKEAGIARGDILPLVRLGFFLVYGVVAIVTVIYQGGLALYYRSRAGLVGEALATPPPPPLESVM